MQFYCIKHISNEIIRIIFRIIKGYLQAFTYDSKGNLAPLNWSLEKLEICL